MEECVHCGSPTFGSSNIDEEFQSCCEEYEDWQDAEESLYEESADDNEEVAFGTFEGNREEAVKLSPIASEVLDEGDDQSTRMILGHEVSPLNFPDGLDEIVLECSLGLPEGNIEAIPDLSLTLSERHKEDYQNSSLGLFEEVAPECLLRLVVDHEQDVSGCLLRPVEDHEGDILECSLRLSEDSREDDSDVSLVMLDGSEVHDLECLLRLSVEHGEDTSQGSLDFSEDCESVSECSLFLSESHESFCSKCSPRFCVDHVEEDDGLSISLFSKGVSTCGDGGLISRVSGIGVIMEKPGGFAFHQVQKKLNFFVEELIAEHLALMDGLLVALQNGFRKVSSFTDSKELYHLIAKRDKIEDQLLIAFRERIQELTNKFESFVLCLASRSEIAEPLQLAREAAGILDQFSECLACGEDKHQSKMIKLECSHKLCVDCMSTYIQNKLQSSQIPVKCPDGKCKCSIPNNKCSSFLPSTSFDSLEREITKTKAQNCLRFYCPFLDCSMMLSQLQSSPSLEASLVQFNNNCIECRKCCRLVCTRCQEPWHPSLSCNEYQSLPSEKRDAGDLNSHQLVHCTGWRVCWQCKRIIELAEGCYSVTCRCGYEFCFSCCSEYVGGVQTCRCMPGDDSSESSSPSQSEPETEPWRWDCFNPLPETIDGYSEQEKTQLALIQRFLTGGISPENHFSRSPPPSPDSYLDIIKDLNQLPWLESFVSVINDNYQEDHIY